MKYFILISLFFFGHLLFAQKHDAFWITGYDGGEISVDQPWFGLSILKFSDFGIMDTINLQNATMDMDFLNVTMSNAEGELQFYTNGVGLNNFHHELMENGNGMSGNPETTGEEGGFALRQGGVGVPWPDSVDQYFLLLERPEYFPTAEDHHFKTTALLSTRIDMASNNGNGQVFEKRIPFLQDTVEFEKSTFTRHANGRDWWYIKNKQDENVFYRILIEPRGAQVIGEQVIGDPIFQGAGQAVFSPDGSKYVLFNGISADVGHYIDIYDFDRCTGLLSNHVEIYLMTDGVSAGVSISPDSRYLYHTATSNIYQYDLWADDIEASRERVATYDGFSDEWGSTRFFAAQLAPDGKIYIICPAGVPWMHTIKYPNRTGEACMVEQHSVKLPTLNAFSIPNNPNYRLGSIDGSPCDTLGIDNMPLSNYRADQDRNNYLSFYFQDLSAYEPAEWQWSFGDGAFSQDTSPVHIYQEDGVYEVCLTVSNENGSHSSCDTLYLGIVNTQEEMVLDIQPQVFPNPFQGQFSFVLNDYYPRHAELLIFDGLGRRLHQQRIFQGWNTVSGSDWADGVYFWELWDAGVFVRRGRLVCKQ